MAKVKPIGHIWGLEFNRYVYFLFRSNWTTFGWDIANSIFPDTAKLTGPRTFADKRWVGPVKLLCIIMFNISKIRPKSVFGPVKAQKFSRCLYFTLKSQGQGHSQGHIWWSHLRPGVQSICLLFVLWQSDHFWQRYGKFHIWPWNFKVKVMAKVKPSGHIWGLEINRHVCFSFHGNRTIFGWDIANSIFDLENSWSKSW